MRLNHRRAAVLLLIPTLGACLVRSPAIAQDTVKAAAVVRPTWKRLRLLTTAQDSTRALAQYAASIPAGEFDTTPERGDLRRLMVGSCPDACRFGPLAKIQPRVRAAQVTRAHRDSGDVIARIISEGPYLHIRGADTSYKFNIHGADTVYWWVGIGKRGDSLVSIFTSTRPGVRPLVSNLVMTHHAPGYWRGIALARWLWSDQDDLAWGTCDGEVCCKSNGFELE